MRRRNNISFKSHVGWDVTDHAETALRRRKWYVAKPFETSSQRLIDK